MVAIMLYVNMRLPPFTGCPRFCVSVSPIVFTTSPSMCTRVPFPFHTGRYVGRCTTHGLEISGGKYLEKRLRDVKNKISYYDSRYFIPYIRGSPIILQHHLTSRAFLPVLFHYVALTEHNTFSRSVTIIHQT